MKKLKALLWTLAGALPACAAVLWIAGAPGILSSNPQQASAQTPDVSTSETSSPTPSVTKATSVPPRQTETTPPLLPGFQARRQLLDFLRWQNLPADQRWTDRQMQSQQEGEEWHRLIEFLHDKSHNRYLLVLRVAPQQGSPIRDRLMQQWLQLEQLERTNAPMFDLRVEEFQTEDTVIGLAAEMRRARRANDRDALMALRDKVHEAASKLVDLNFSERELRITTAQTLLDQEKSRLETDRAQKDHLTDQKSRQLMQQFEMSFASRLAPATRPADDPSAGK